MKMGSHMAVFLSYVSLVSGILFIEKNKGGVCYE